MEYNEHKIIPPPTKERGLEILAGCIGEEISPLPAWQEGKLVLWYGGEWVQYEEYSDESESRSRYPAGAYMQTIALNPSVITEPKFIADAAMRINQQFEDDEFAGGFMIGMRCPDDVIESKEEAQAILLLTGDYGRAGHWPSGYDWEKDAFTWQLQPEQLGAAIATLIDPEWVDPIVKRMLSDS